MTMTDIMALIKRTLGDATSKQDIHRRVRAEMTHLCELEKDDEITFAQYCNACRFLFDKAAEREAEL